MAALVLLSTLAPGEAKDIKGTMTDAGDGLVHGIDGLATGIAHGIGSVISSRFARPPSVPPPSPSPSPLPPPPRSPPAPPPPASPPPPPPPATPPAPPSPPSPPSAPPARETWAIVTTLVVSGLLLFAGAAFFYLRLTARPQRQANDPSLVEIQTAQAQAPGAVGGGTRNKRGRVSAEKVARERAARPTTFATLAGLAAARAPAPVVDTSPGSYLPPLIRAEGASGGGAAGAPAPAPGFASPLDSHQEI